MLRLLSLLFAFTLLVSCAETQESKSRFSVEPSSVEFSALGGYGEVSYSIEATNGINPVAITQAEWIVDVDNSELGVIGFCVLPNDSDTPREAIVTLRHISTSETPCFVVIV